MGSEQHVSNGDTYSKFHMYWGHTLQFALNQLNIFICIVFTLLKSPQKWAYYHGLLEKHLVKCKFYYNNPKHYCVPQNRFKTYDIMFWHIQTFRWTFHYHHYSFSATPASSSNLHDHVVTCRNILEYEWTWPCHNPPYLEIWTHNKGIFSITISLSFPKPEKIFW